MPQLDKFTYFSQFFWLCLFLLIFYIPIRNDGDGVLGISRILKLRNQLLSHRGNNIRSKDPKSLEDILRKGFSTGVSYMDSTLFEVSQWCKAVDLLGKRFISPLRWQQVFGTGSAILAAFLALAGAAWSLDLTDLLYFNLLGAIYWLFIYLYLYIEIWWWVYERTKEWINNTWLIQKMKRAFMLERQAIVFILQNSFLISSFGIYIWCYQLMFPEIEKGNLVNPLQVIAQLSCFLLNFKYPLKPVRVRRLLLMSLFLSLLSSLHLQGIDWEILSLVLFFFIICIILVPLDYANLIIFFGYFLDEGLAKWGFYLAFQQVGHYALSFFLAKERSTPKKRLLSFILLLLIQLIFGFVYYKDFYLMEPQKLAALLSGACIIFLSLKRRTKGAFLIAFFLYVLVSIFIGLKSSPSDKTTIWGIPHGIFIFVFLHFWPFLGWLFFKDSLPRRKQPLVPLFFSGLFFLLCHFPELAWLEKWIEGMDLLLLILGLFSFVEDDQRRITTITKANSRLKKEKKKFLLQQTTRTTTSTTILKLSSFGSILN